MRDFIKWFLLWIEETNAQPKELYAWEEIETSQGITLGKDYIPNLNVNPVSIQSVIRTMAYGDGMTVKKMQHHEH